MRINPVTSTVVAVAAVALTVGSAIPASAADTIATFTLTGGALSISAPASSALGTGTAGGAAFSAQMGAVQVTDNRGLADAFWAADVTSGNFVTDGVGSPVQTITAAGNVAYWSGPATASTGGGTVIPGQADAAAAESIVAQDAFDKTAGAGNNSTTWNPTVIVTPPAQSVVGTYSATVTHTVA